MTITIVVPGPLHPDLFGGMTPIMQPVEVSAYEVDVVWTELRQRSITVLARDEREAMAFARRKAASAINSVADGRVYDLSVSDDVIELRDIDDHVIETEIAWYRQTIGENNAKSVCSVTGRTR